MRILSSYFLFAILILASCSDDNDPASPGGNPDNTTGQLELSFTDAPIDNAEVTSCIVTVSAIKVDGNKVEGFQKTSIDLLTYQNGSVFTPGTFDVAAGTYGEITFVLDSETDDAGNSPGSYIIKADGTKDALLSSGSELKISHNTLVEEDKKTSVVADFDLRKAVYLNNDNNTESDYKFVEEAELKAAVRLVNSENSGILKGSVSGNFSSEGAIVAYLYERGSFNQSSELSGQGSGNIMFQNAISSTKTDADGNFELHFLNEGDYDLYFASYKNDSNGHLKFEGLFSINTLLDQLTPVEVSINASATATMNISLNGLISL